MRYQRLKESPEELDAEENRWWDKNALTVESVWAHTKEWQKIIRSHYLKKAKRFFTSSKKKVDVLELGCGSGWVGRQIAGENCRILGTDFSKEQILLAEELAKKYNLDQYCKYEVADSTDFAKNFDGVLIHGFLHHLSEIELNNFFSNIAKFPQGTKIFMYEPTFVKRVKGNGLMKLFSKIFRFSINIYVKICNGYIKLGNRVDAELKKNLDDINKQATERGWFISPKEIPFFEDEISQRCEKYFLIRKSFWVNSTDFNIAQTSMLYNKTKPNWLDRFIIMPIAIVLDKIYLNHFCKYVAYEGEYHFKCFVLIIK